MRLFHVSEEPDIAVFHPRKPTRTDLDPDVGLVWAIDEARLPNFLTPRDCPRVTYHVGPETTEDDRARFFSSGCHRHAVIIENRWYAAMAKTTLYLYEFDPADFTLQDPVAGYYTAQVSCTPIAKHTITDLFAELFRRQIEVRMVNSLWDMAEAVQHSTLQWSLCRMRNAAPKTE